MDEVPPGFGALPQPADAAAGYTEAELTQLSLALETYTSVLVCRICFLDNKGKRGVVKVLLDHIYNGIVFLRFNGAYAPIVGKFTLR